MTSDPGNAKPNQRRLEEAVTREAGGPTRPRLPKQIGHFHVKDVLASGGMGVVYRAVQEQPRRTVAVKVMRQGIASRSAMRRFEYESQVLARLHHPGIAQVFEAGTHDDGEGAVPYFAMEYIPNAKPITQFAQEKSLGTRERLQLFLRVCDPVHHGHQKAIIHRDLKPDNILVDPHGDVKIIDFGVARGTDSDLAVTTLQTDVGQLVGTLQYMSPEQCEADPDAIDARSDVYALGVVLYELITGQLPYAISGTHVLHSAEVIREQPPTKPSTINRSLRGDIETIVLTSLEKDRQRRYASVADLAKDVQLYLNGEAIRARPPSSAYKLYLYARRHRAGLVTFTAIVLVAAAAAILVSRSRDRARQAEDAMAAALARATQAEKAARASKAVGPPMKGKTTDLIGRIPGEFVLETTAGRTIGTADFAKSKATVLNFVAADCPFCFQQVPLVEEIRQQYEPKGVRFVNIALPFLGTFTGQESWDAFAKVGSRIELASNESNSVGRLFNITGYPRLCILDRAGTVRHVINGAKRDLMARLRGQLDALLLGIRTPEEKLAEAEKLNRHTLENTRRTLGEDNPETLRSMENLAATLTERGKHNEAEGLYRDICSIRQRFLGESDPTTLESMHKLGASLHQRQKFMDAEAIHRQVLHIRRRVLGEDHADTRLSMAHLGMALQSQGKTEDAGPYVAELIALRKLAADERDADATTLNEYAWLLVTCKPIELRDPQAALLVAEEAARLSGRQKPEILDTLALAQKMTGDLASAIETQKDAVALIPFTNFQDRGAYAETLLKYLEEAGDTEGQEQWLRDNLAQTRESMPAGSVNVAFALVGLGVFLIEQEQYPEAEVAWREVLDIGRKLLPAKHWRLSQMESALGRSLAGQAKFETAEPLVVDAYHNLKDNPQVPNEDKRVVIQNVIFLYTEWEKPEKAARFRAMLPPADAADESNP